MFILCCDTVTKVFAGVKKLWKISFKIIMSASVDTIMSGWSVCNAAVAGLEKVQVCGARSA